ncbi:SRPBCC domain-containing protein [Kitasatospora viridis]|uniref:Uncharacterized protein YndB with AHSA1/START domain n=1 Tax=Kitasatospora viridis TaxID=281105 RepID=A0A561TT87_9ACTN|nr:SRPBCC domain-containing protein [Kitasatospora viridis]TWF90325.1 uncharacterized protein YndB with AHSA1/START domain [Kitasatospora viridis]
MAETHTFSYTLYLGAGPEQVWRALTDAEATGRYWGHRNVSDWQPGSRWEHQRTDGSGVADVIGTVLEARPPRRLVSTWARPDQDPADPAASVVTFDLEPYHELVRLTVTHEKLADAAELAAAAKGWAAVLSNLKTYLETGRPLPHDPWLMP